MNKISDTTTNANSGSVDHNDVSYAPDFYTKRLNVIHVAQEYTYYCVPASIQSIFWTLGAGVHQYSQQNIYEYFLHIDHDMNEGDGINFDQNLVDYMNHNLRIFNPDLASRMEFSLLAPGSSIGHNREELFLFQSFVISNLDANIPILFGGAMPYTVGTEHAVVLTGIEVANNPSDTVYTYMDPRTGNNYTFTGSDLPTITDSGLTAVGINTENFNFKNKKIAINLTDPALETALELGKQQVISAQVNLTETAGITSLSSFQNLNLVTLPGYTNNIKWKNQHKSFNSETWLISKFVMNKSLSWTYDTRQSFNNADLTYKMEYESVLWTNHSDNLMLTLRYRFQLNVMEGKPFETIAKIGVGHMLFLTF